MQDVCQKRLPRKSGVLFKIVLIETEDGSGDIKDLSCLETTKRKKDVA